MERMNEADRTRWMHGKSRDHMEVSAAVSRGEHQCDTCEEPAVAIGHGGEGTPVNVECGPCFLARMARERASRPTREELIARVDAALCR